MRRFAAIALLSAVAALPACAQRGAARGGFSGHSAPSFHGGFSGSSHLTAPTHFAAPPRFASSSSARSTAYFSRGSTGSYGTAHQPNYPASRYRQPYRSRYAVGVPYAFPGGVISWINPDFLGYPGYYDDFSAAADTTDTSVAYDAQLAGQDQPEVRTPYEPSYAPVYPQQQGAPVPEDAVTLVFRDGRPSQQIHNYALTRSTLYVLDPRHQEIPIEDLDLAATEKVNRDAGVDFQLPVVVQ